MGRGPVPGRGSLATGPQTDTQKLYYVQYMNMVQLLY